MDKVGHYIKVVNEWNPSEDELRFYRLFEGTPIEVHDWLRTSVEAAVATHVLVGTGEVVTVSEYWAREDI